MRNSSTLCRVLFFPLEFIPLFCYPFPMDNLPVKPSEAQPPAPVENAKDSESLLIGIPQDDGTLKVRRITTKEEKAIQALVTTGNPGEAAIVAGMSGKELATFFAQKDIQQHIDNVQNRMVKSRMMTEDRMKALVSDAVQQVEKNVSDGDSLKREDVTIIALGCEVVGLKRNKIDVNVTAVKSPYADLSIEELDNMIAQRKAYMADREAHLARKNNADSA